MDLREAIYSRRAVREFTAEPVDEKTIRELIDAAIQAPSAVNQQPWSFCVVRDQAVLARISSEAKAHMLRTSPAALLPHISGTAEQPNLQYFLSCAGARPDIERGGKPVGGRELLAGGREPDAGGPRRRIGDMLDRLRAEMACNAGRKSGAEPPGKLYACGSHHRRASESRAAAGCQKRAGYTLDRRVSVSPPATRPALL